MVIAGVQSRAPTYYLALQTIGEVLLMVLVPPPKWHRPPHGVLSGH